MAAPLLSQKGLCGPPKSRVGAQPTEAGAQARSGTRRHPLRKCALGGVSWGCPAERGVQSLKPLQCNSLSWE